MQKNVSNMHYHVQDTVLYGQSGVCRIADIAEKDVGGGLRAYYVLQPVFEESATIFVPVGNEALTAKMRRVMSEAEITALIDAMPEEDSIWIADDNARRERYKAILAGGDPSDLHPVDQDPVSARPDPEGPEQKAPSGGRALHEAGGKAAV